MLTVAYAIFSLVGFGTGPHRLHAPRVGHAGDARRAAAGPARRHPAPSSGLHPAPSGGSPALLRLVPGMAVSQAIGVALLAVLPVSLTAALLGGFVMALRRVEPARRRPRNPPPTGAAWAWGIGGGMLAVFGSGGFMCSCRPPPAPPADRNAFRATQAVLVSISTPVARSPAPPPASSTARCCSPPSSCCPPPTWASTSPNRWIADSVEPSGTCSTGY